MRLKKSVKEEIDDLIQQQIVLLLKRKKAIGRVFDIVQYESITNEYLKLESQIKTLTTSVKDNEIVSLSQNA